MARIKPVKHITTLGDYLQTPRFDDLLEGLPGTILPSYQTRPIPEIEAKPELIRDKGGDAIRQGVPDTQAYGATGTPILSGFVTDLQEYNAKLRGRTAMPIYEEMRRADGDIAAILAACKLPIRAADRTILPAVKQDAPEYKRAQEEAEFVKENLFGGLEYENALGVKISQRFESVIENALLCLDFGCSGSEDLWTVDGDTVRLRKIAPRLPLTFYRFHVEIDGETLRAVEQWGYRGWQWVTVIVPSNKFTLFSYRMEGGNFYGMSMLRHAYKHWWIKDGLYRIDAIACERNGAGVPTFTMGPNPSSEDKQAAFGWAQDLSTHEATSLVIPYEWKFELNGVKGTEHKLGPSIQHHSEMICRSVLAMFMALGTTQSGSRSLGNTMVDFFQLAEDATARFIADTISETTIRRLIDYNFPRPEGKPFPYPRLIFSNIAVLNPLDIVSAVKEIAGYNVDMIQPDDETENWFRKKLGVPLKSEKIRVRYAPVVQRVQEQGGDPTQEEEEGNAGGTAKTPEQIESQRSQSDAAKRQADQPGAKQAADGKKKQADMREGVAYRGAVLSNNKLSQMLELKELTFGVDVVAATEDGPVVQALTERDELPSDRLVVLELHGKTRLAQNGDVSITAGSRYLVDKVRYEHGITRVTLRQQE